MVSPVPADVMERFHAARRRVASNHLLGVEKLSGYLRDVEAGKAGNAGLRAELTKLGVTSSNIGEIERDKLKLLADAMGSKDSIGFQTHRQSLTDIATAHDGMSESTAKVLRGEGYEIPEGYRKTVIAEVRGELDKARTQIKSSLEQAKAAKAAIGTAQEAARASERKLLDFIGSHNTLHSVEPRLKESLGNIRHRGHSLFAENNGARLTEETFAAIKAVVNRVSPGKLEQVTALTDDIVKARRNVIQTRWNARGLERQAQATIATFKKDLPHLEGHRLLPEVEQVATSTALSTVETAAKDGAKAASKMSGKTKWIIGGITAAVVGLGAVMMIGRNKNHAEDEMTRRAQAAGETPSIA
jgi:hypothetical protein